MKRCPRGGHQGAVLLVSGNARTCTEPLLTPLICRQNGLAWSRLWGTAAFCAVAGATSHCDILLQYPIEGGVGLVPSLLPPLSITLGHVLPVALVQKTSEVALAMDMSKGVGRSRVL